MDPRLSEAARTGNIDALYTLIQEDPCILEPIDQVPFVDTPLHIAASEGHINFSLEMMNLKPPFARKLNQDGWSPMHLATEKKLTKVVIRFLESDHKLARVKGKEGMTPLHLAAKTGNLDLLFELLEACPECIQDVTVNNDTALHLALKNDQIKAFGLLMGWLHYSLECTIPWTKQIFNWKDNKDNTLLHIAAENNQAKALKQLSSSIYLEDVHVKNSDGLTALEIIKPGSNYVQKQEIKSEPKYTKGIKSDRKYLQQITVWRRWKNSLSIEMLNTALVITALVITATLQSSLSPPGGVFPPPETSPTANTTHVVHDSAAGNSFWKVYYVKPRNPGTVVMNSEEFFLSFWIVNSFTLCVTIAMTAYLLFPSFMPILLPLSSLAGCYYISMSIISPSTAWYLINLITGCVMVFIPLSPPLTSLLPNLKNIIKLGRDKDNFLRVLPDCQATRIEA